VKRLIVLVLAVLVIVLAGCGTAVRPSEPEPQGKKAPAFALPELAGGKTVQFPEDFRRRPVVLIFFSPG